MLRGFDASSSILYAAQQDMFMKKLVFNCEKFSGSWVVIYVSFRSASNPACSVNGVEKYGICLPTLFFLGYIYICKVVRWAAF